MALTLPTPYTVIGSLRSTLSDEATQACMTPTQMTGPASSGRLAGSATEGQLAEEADLRRRNAIDSNQP